MVFSSIPAYLDPSNWQQQHHHHQQNQSGFHHGITLNQGNLTNPNPLLPPPPLPPPQHPRSQPPPPNTSPMSAAAGSLIRPGSMAERARMANIPMPEMALKCPRCESTNTKFCYFNNYSLSQPRHFCKTCRRYWTRGGALRSVPVGGGCRRNKRSKSSSSSNSNSKSSSAPPAPATSSVSSAGGSGSGSHSSMAEMMGLTSPPPQVLSSLRFMTPLHHLTDFGEQLGLTNYGGISASGDLGFHLGNNGPGGPDSQWRNIISPPGLTQFPFLDGAGSSLYGHHPFEGVEFSSLAIGGSGGPVRSKAAEAEAVKVEERGEERRFNNEGNGGEEYNWGGGSNNISGGINGWTDLSGLNNSSCSTTSAL